MHFLPYIIRLINDTVFGEACSMQRERQSKGKRPDSKPACRWEDNIKINLEEIICGQDSCGSE